MADMSIDRSMAQLTLDDIRAEPFLFLELEISSLQPETTLTRKYAPDVAGMIFYSIRPKFTADIKITDLRVTASSNERSYTIRAGTTIASAIKTLFDPTITVECDDSATMVLTCKEVEAASTSVSSSAGSFWWVHIICMAREPTSDAQIIREISPVLASKGFRDVKMKPLLGKELQYNRGILHVEFVPDPRNGIDHTTLYTIKNIKLSAGTSVRLNFRDNDRLKSQLGLCGDCICRRCECQDHAPGGKRVRDAREAFAERAKKRAEAAARK